MSLQLRVDSAYPGDQGGGKVRIDPETMLSLKTTAGELVVIEGKRRTVAKVWRALVEDWNQRKIRIDNFTRANAGVAIGDSVKVLPVTEEIEAKHVVLAPSVDLPKKIPVANNPHVINGLIDFPAMKNDIVPILLGLPFVQPQIVSFKVMEIEPEGAVIITKNTTIEFCEKPVNDLKGTKRFSYEDIGGLKAELLQLREMIELPIRHPEIFQALGVNPVRGIILHGPSGTGKTLTVKTLASENGVNLILTSGYEIISTYQKQGEPWLHQFFKDACENAPTIIFIDKLESLAAPKGKDISDASHFVATQLLAAIEELDNCAPVWIIGETSSIDLIDLKLRRFGRLDHVIKFSPPNESDRIEIFKIHARNMPLTEDVDLEAISKQTKGFVGADLAALTREAAFRALRRYLPELDLDKDEIDPETLGKLKIFAADFMSALQSVDIQGYESSGQK